MEVVEPALLLQLQRQVIQLQVQINFMVAQVVAVGVAMLIATLLVLFMAYLAVELLIMFRQAVVEEPTGSMFQGITTHRHGMVHQLELKE
jgi:hypothetical protein